MKTSMGADSLSLNLRAVSKALGMSEGDVQRLVGAGKLTGDLVLRVTDPPAPLPPMRRPAPVDKKAYEKAIRDLAKRVHGGKLPPERTKHQIAKGHAERIGGGSL